MFQISLQTTKDVWLEKLLVTNSLVRSSSLLVPSKKLMRNPYACKLIPVKIFDGLKFDAVDLEVQGG